MEEKSIVGCCADTSINHRQIVLSLVVDISGVIIVTRYGDRMLAPRLCQVRSWAATRNGSGHVNRTSFCRQIRQPSPPGNSC